MKDFFLNNLCQCATGRNILYLQGKKWSTFLTFFLTFLYRGKKLLMLPVFKFSIWEKELLQKMTKKPLCWASHTDFNSVFNFSSSETRCQVGLQFQTFQTWFWNFTAPRTQTPKSPTAQSGLDLVQHDACLHQLTLFIRPATLTGALWWLTSVCVCNRRHVCECALMYSLHVYTTSTH